MEEALKNLVQACENISDLLVEGLTDTQYENWSLEIDQFLDRLNKASLILKEKE